MQSALIENGVVTNVIVGTSGGFTICPDNVGIGWLYDGDSFSAPVVVESFEQQRAAAYAPKGDQLDAILGGFVAVSLAGIDLPSDLDGVISEWQQVKIDIPKT